MYDLGCILMVLNGLSGLYGLKYDSATAWGLPLYLCSYKLVGSATCYIGIISVRLQIIMCALIYTNKHFWCHCWGTVAELTLSLA